MRSGYVIPFESIPPGVCLSSNRSALEHRDFVSSAVCDLLELGLISEVLTPSTVINPLSVSVHSEGKPRFILDLCHVNSYIPKAKFSMEDWKVFLQYLSRGGFMYKFDLKSGYHHIESVSPIISSWVFSGPWVVLEAGIFVLLSYLLGFRLLLTCLPSFSAR